MRLFITGSTGLVGRRLVLDRLERGDEVVLLSRDPARAVRLFAANANRNIVIESGDPSFPGDWQEALSGCDGVIHLAGASIADRRWSTAYKKMLYASRIDSTHQIVSAIERARQRPAILINASGIGYYGDRGDAELTEESPPGRDFLSQLCVAWEAQAVKAVAMGVRVVPLRIAMVLDDRGGALKKLTLPFKFLAGGPIGSGRQYSPWIHWRDLIGLIDFALQDRRVVGPLNATSPTPVRQRELAHTIGALLGRPSIFPTPKFALRLAFGEMAGAIVASQRAIPAKALQFGYSFLHREIEPALASLLTPETTETAESESAADRVHVTAAHTDAKTNVVDQKQPAEPASPIKLVAIAVDGVLLNSDGSIAHVTAQACRAVERAACAVVLATARPPRGMRAIVQALNLQSPVINFNGAAIWDSRDDKPQFHEPLSPDVAQSLIGDIRKIQSSVSISVEVLDRWFAERIDSFLSPPEDAAAQPHAIGPIDHVLRTPVTKINIAGTPEQIQLLMPMVREQYWKPRKVSVFLTDPRLIQIMHPMVDKGIALQILARRMSVQREQVMAIGAGPTDAGMVEWAGFSVALENAVPAVKQLAKAIMPSNNDQGVAKALQRFVLARR
jgi:uncharacterized protein